ncbi:MAG: hypothetical protein ACXAE3_02455 [Candidatus Kariarchaeaceae archaeon]|jgi:hypothetical protein
MSENGEEPKQMDQETSPEKEPEMEIGSDNSEEENSSSVINLQDLAAQYQQEYRPRPFPVQVLLALMFLFGPIFLLLDLLIDGFFAFLDDLSLYIFGGITAILFASILVRAYQESRKFR